jgi:hypothetical protein
MDKTLIFAEHSLHTHDCKLMYFFFQLYDWASTSPFCPPYWLQLAGTGQQIRVPYYQGETRTISGIGYVYCSFTARKGRSKHWMKYDR